MARYEAACGRCYTEYELDEKPDNAIFCPNCRKHGGPLVGVLNFEECVDDTIAEADSLRAQLKASQADVKLLREALTEARCWIPDGSRTTPMDRGAKCDTFSEARWLMTTALAATAPKE